MDHRILALFLVALIAVPASAQETKISGYMFGDAYVLAGAPNDVLEGRTGFQFRRIYVTLDRGIADNFDIRFRVEAAQPGDFETKGKMDPFVKDAFLRWKKSGHEVYFGLSSTPTWDRLESFWGLRSVEKTPLDLYKYGSSRDIGIAASGPIGSGERVTYHAMVANGAGTSSETNDGKKAYLALAAELIEGLTIEAYGDFEARRGDNDATTFQGALMYGGGWGRLGLSASRTTIRVENSDANTFDVASIFVASEIASRTTAFIRVDRQFDVNPSAAKIAYLPFAPADETTFVVAGVSVAATSTVFIQPNVEVVTYHMDEGDAPDPTIMPRITVYFKF